MVHRDEVMQIDTNNTNEAEVNNEVLPSPKTDEKQRLFSKVMTPVDQEQEIISNQTKVFIQMNDSESYNHSSSSCSGSCSNNSSRNEVDKTKPTKSGTQASRNTPAPKNINKTANAPYRSHMDMEFNFDEKKESKEATRAFLQEQALFSKTFEKLPLEIEFDTLKEFEQSIGRNTEDVLDLKENITAINTNTCNHKWPTPKSIEEVRQLCDVQSAEGNKQSQLALCLHLLESAYSVDPNNDTRILPEDTDSKRASWFIDDLISSFKKATTAPTTLAEALIFESKKLLNKLAHGSQFAGEGGDSEAQFILGSCYGMGGLGCHMNHKRAFKWYLQASKYDHAEATYRTGVCYELGLGTEKNGACAVQFFRKAAHLGHVPGMYKLGIILMRGYCDVDANRREAIIWLQRAACVSIAPLAHGSSTTTGGYGGIALPHALYALAIIHMSRECEDTSLISDHKYAMKLFHDSARFGYAPSQYKLGQEYEKKDEKEYESIYWYTMAAKQDYPEACLALSNWYMTGSMNTTVLEQSDDQAFKWAKKAAILAKAVRSEEISAQANYTLAIYHEKGIGTNRSPIMAEKYYKRAAQHGHPKALHIVRQL